MEINMRGLCPLIQVFDMDNSLHFYCELLGFEIVEKAAGGGWAWRRHGTAELMLNTVYDEGERPEKPDPARLLAHEDTGFGFFNWMSRCGQRVRIPPGERRRRVKTEGCLVRNEANVPERS